MSEELERRVAKLEAQVDWLLTQQQHPSRTPAVDPVVPPRPRVPTPPRPAPPPRPPAAPFNPTVWVAGAGAALFLVGVIFFLVWSIQQGWLGPEMRLLLGLGAGVVLTGIAAALILGRGRALGVAVLLAGLGTLQFTFRAGALNYHFFPPALGFAAAAIATLFAGGLAARAKSGGALGMALVSGFLAPIVFSEGGHHEVALALYLAALMVSATIVPYVSGEGARWGGSRWFAVFGTWVLLAVAASSARAEDAPLVFLLLGVHLLLTGLWIWLPGTADKPATPTLLWILVSFAATSLGAVLWHTLDWPTEWYAGPVLVVAALNLALVPAMRWRLGSRQADLGLLVLAVGHLACAIPIALAWRWVGPLWALLALGLAAVSRTAEDGPYAAEGAALRKLAFAMAAAASVRWMIHGIDFWWTSPTRIPFANAVFFEGAVTALAWLLLAPRGRVGGGLALVGAELVGNLTLAFECGYAVWFLLGGTSADWSSYRAPSIAITLVFALSGALQWLFGVRRVENRIPLLAAGYVWLAIASVKLVVADLSTASTPLRALAFLGVGGIFIVAALVGHRLRPQEGA
jgi:hypothetical protein